MERVHLKNLDTNVYEHPFDKAALNTLRNLPGFDKVTNFILNWAAVRWNLVAMQGSNFHVTPESCRTVQTGKGGCGDSRSGRFS